MKSNLNVSIPAWSPNLLQHSPQNCTPILTPDMNHKMLEVRIFNRQSIFIKLDHFFITIKKLKEIINKNLEYTSNEIDLYFNGVYMEDSKLITDYKINYNSHIHIQFRSKVYRNIKFETNDEYFVVDIKD